MPRRAQQATTQAEAIVTVELPTSLVGELKPTEVAQHVTLLRGFRDLVGERMGYLFARRLTQQEMNEKTEAERKAVAELRKDITGDKLKTIITNGDIATYETRLSEIKSARETLSKASKPFREKISPLARAQKYLDSVAIPDALKELGTPIQPRFSLSKWISDALAAAKKKK